MDEPETYWSGVARFLWPALVGLGLAAALFHWSGSQALWISAAGLLLTALLVSYMAREGRLFLREQRVELGSSAESFLTPLAREVLGHLPDPLMLLDEGGRVLFANSAMYTVIGVGPEKKHVSLLLRTPSVLAAIEQTSATGEAASFEFTVPVP
ncbi:MAG TPA: PAS domain-containing protein, partial [Thermodesulfobacteriota bacterium]|nr:PAS domain-containing protein [Thermodesulfobacteriota bacterium]